MNYSAQALAGFDVLFDLNLDDDASRLARYALLKDKMVVGCAVKRSLRQMRESCKQEIHCHLAGMNALPTFINRSLAELSLLREQDKKPLDDLFRALQWDYLLVDDQPGMVTPRVVAMLINEAWFVLSEETASRDDIDMSMKLGTNYPYGPFEWCDKIGIRDVYETLHALAINSNESRYRICTLLQEQYRNATPFFASGKKLTTE